MLIIIHDVDKHKIVLKRVHATVISCHFHEFFYQLICQYIMPLLKGISNDRRQAHLNTSCVND